MPPELRTLREAVATRLAAPAALISELTKEAEAAGLVAAGELADVRIGRDRDTGRAKGFAHIEFATLEGAAAAIALSGSTLLDREISIETTTEREKRERQHSVA